MKSLPPREAWIEIYDKENAMKLTASLPPREAWIEIEHHRKS